MSYEAILYDVEDGVATITLNKPERLNAFDNQMLAQVLWFGYVVAEVSCPTKYFPEASSIDFPRSVRYGLGCVATAIGFRLAKMGLLRSRLFPPAL